eukprot:9288552-Lingulodinium_polyedra.AAC.1
MPPTPTTLCTGARSSATSRAKAARPLWVREPLTQTPFPNADASLHESVGLTGRLRPTVASGRQARLNRTSSPTS